MQQHLVLLLIIIFQAGALLAGARHHSIRKQWTNESQARGGGFPGLHKTSFSVGRSRRQLNYSTRDQRLILYDRFSHQRLLSPQIRLLTHKKIRPPQFISIINQQTIFPQNYKEKTAPLKI